jgi:hypothetical protein
MMALARRDGLFFTVMFFALLGRLLLSPPIWHHGEAREGFVVQGIVRNHEWILPLRKGELIASQGVITTSSLIDWIRALGISRYKEMFTEKRLKYNLGSHRNPQFAAYRKRGHQAQTNANLKPN